METQAFLQILPTNIYLLTAFANLGLPNSTKHQPPNHSIMQNRRSFIKKSGSLFAAGLLPLSAFSILRTRQGQAENIVVTLYVDTGSIEKNNSAVACHFGQPEGVSNEEFTIDANVGDTITWVGVSTSAPETDQVNIRSINHEGGKNVFGQNVLIGDRGAPEKVVGKIVSTTGNEKRDFFKYKLSFTVKNNGQNRNGTFHIDPVIRVH